MAQKERAEVEAEAVLGKAVLESMHRKVSLRSSLEGGPGQAGSLEPLWGHLWTNRR